MRRQINGYVDMGQPQIPPRPNYIVMTDRSNGTDYVLAYTGGTGTATIAPSATMPRSPDVSRFGAYDGPYLNGAVRLYMSGGTLTGEAIDPADLPVNTPRVFARKGNSRLLLEVLAPEGWEPGDALTYTEVQL